MRTWSLVIVMSLGLSACGNSFPAPRGEKPTAPDTNDAAYTVDGVHEWWLVPNAATTPNETMTILVTVPAGTDFVDAWVADVPAARLSEQPNGQFGVQVSLAGLPPGTHEVLLAANGATTAFAKMSFKRTAPYYVLVTTDWDFSDPGNQANTYQDLMHRDHAELRITHFVGPYTFTDPMVSEAREAELVTWLVKQRDTFGDEIGLHIHPYCNFVTTAGLTCITDQSTVYPNGDPSGYTVKLGPYGRDDFGRLLDRAKELFTQHGLNVPRTFRAGGWTATLETLAALADKGFVADTSALNWKRIEEWTGKELYRWNMENWNPIDDTTQPYYPSMTNVLTSTTPTLPILEVPDNGVMIDYVSLPEMTGLFDANWDGQPLTSPRTLMMGFHPATPGFSEAEYKRVDGFLKYADLRGGTAHLGPVVYITLEDIVAAYAP
jgi:hypothetical protein